VTHYHTCRLLSTEVLASQIVESLWSHRDVVRRLYASDVCVCGICLEHQLGQADHICECYQRQRRLWV